MADRLFTLEEARALVPAIDGILAEIQQLRRQVETVQAIIETIRRSTGANGGAVHTDSRAQQERATGLTDRIRERIHDLHALEIQVKDVDKGLVDFLALHRGERVFLCWQRGEPTVEWWHSIPDGFAGRQRILPDDWE